MPTIQKEVLDSFYARLVESDEVDGVMVQKLRALFSSGKKLKADDFVAVFRRPTEESVP